MTSRGNSGISDFLRTPARNFDLHHTVAQQRPATAQCEFDAIVTQVLKFAYVNCSFGNRFSSASKLKIKVVAGVYVLARGSAFSWPFQVLPGTLPAQIKISFKRLCRHHYKARTTSQQTCNHHWQRIKPQMGCARSNAECQSWCVS